ncbi:MAG: hypothetical protein V1896_02955 [Candidatus Zambryskibacteria bacterium]
MDYKETIKERIKILPEQLRAFMVDEKWRGDAQRVSERFSFDEEKYALFENEVFLVLLCLEPPTDFAESIKKELGIDNNMAGWIAEDVNKNIFSKVSDEITSMWQMAEQAENVTNKVGTDFEQIILNQAKAMQPAVASPKLGYGVAKPAVDERRREETPNNLPTGEGQAEEKPKAIHNYVPGTDPYREPIE